MGITEPRYKLPADTAKALDALDRERRQQERIRRTEEYRRLAIKEINRFAREHCKYLRDKYQIDELLPSPVHVSLKKPKEYYDAIFEAAALMKRDTYLLDRKVGDMLAEVLPEACRRTNYNIKIPTSVYYNEFSPALHRRINTLMADFRPGKDCTSLSKVAALIKAGRKPKAAKPLPTGQDFPEGKFYFNGDGSVCWFGNELKIQRKGAGKTQYVRVGGKDVNVFKTLEGRGIDRATVETWVRHAEEAYRKRQSHEAQHEENKETWGTKYD